MYIRTTNYISIHQYSMWPVFIYSICFLLLFITSLIEFVDMIKGLPNRLVLSNAQVNYNGKNVVSQNSHRFIDIRLIICHLNVFNVIM